MGDNVFPYPGAKSLMSEWIISHFPEHQVYVEPFGGSAAVLVNKEPSYVEVFNDKDGDIVHFFETLRDHGEELEDWLRQTPFSRSLHSEYADKFFKGYRPVDDVERAGRFFYLRNTQFAQKHTEKSGFRLSTQTNHATEYQTRIEDLREFARRLQKVQIENLDYAELVDRTDGEDTLFYFDPPYVDAGDALYSHSDRFDHERFADVLEGIEGDWIVSYTELPEALSDGYYVVEQERRGTMRAGQDDREQRNTERLVMNFDPNQAKMFSKASQSTLGQSVAATDGGSSE